MSDAIFYRRRQAAPHIFLFSFFFIYTIVYILISARNSNLITLRYITCVNYTFTSFHIIYLYILFMLPYLQTYSLQSIFALNGQVHFKVIVFIITNKNNQCIPHRGLLFIYVGIILDYQTPIYLDSETRSIDEFLLPGGRV